MGVTQNCQVEESNLSDLSDSSDTTEQERKRATRGVRNQNFVRNQGDQL